MSSDLPEVVTADDYIGELEASIEVLSDENTEQGKKLDRNAEIVGRAISDLRSIGYVPLRDIDGYVDAVIGTLRAVI